MRGREGQRYEVDRKESPVQCPSVVDSGDNIVRFSCATGNIVCFR